jgi:hypothetical protein
MGRGIYVADDFLGLYNQNFPTDKLYEVWARLTGVRAQELKTPKEP